jgi:hypothetical protein
MVRPLSQIGGVRDAAYLFWSCPDLLGYFWTTAWRMAPKSTPGYKPELDEPGLADSHREGGK